MLSLQKGKNQTNTVGCHYKVVQYNMIDNPYLTQRASYGMPLERILEKIDQIIMAPHCIGLPAW